MATTLHLRRINQRKVIQAMMRLRTASRAELAREAGLSQPTVGRIVDQMLATSVLSVGRSDSVSGGGGDFANGEGPALGRPSTPLELDHRRRRFVTIQLGVSQTRIAALPMAVSDANQWDLSFDTPDSPDGFGRALHDHWKRVVPRHLQAVVLSLPGVVDERAPRVLFSPNLHWTERADFPAIFRTVTRAPLICIQEIRALALGQLAAEPAGEDFLLVDFGSGVGAAAVIGQKLYESPFPLSGELGHAPVLGNRRVCSCGATGCLETLVSRNGLLATSRENGGPGEWERLIAYFQRGELPAWIIPSLDAVATTIAGGLNLMGTRRTILTGSFNELPAVADYICAAVKRAAMWSRFGDVRCETAPRRRMMGMASLAINEVLLVEPPAAVTA
jgi:predicted NBD/HSP70 family sugar kinase